MAIQSTSKMLAQMISNTKAKVTSAEQNSVADVQQTEYTIPQLKPANDMEHVLANILGASASKKHTPMD